MAEGFPSCDSDGNDIQLFNPSSGSFSSGAGAVGMVGNVHVGAAPELPSTASEWKAEHARDINITYHNRAWRSIKAQFDYLKPDRSTEHAEWRAITDVFKGLMDAVPMNIDSALSSRVAKILRKKITAGVSIEYQKGLSGEDMRAICFLLGYVKIVREKISSRRVAKEMVRRTGAKESLHLFIPNICMFLDAFIIILSKFYSGIPPTEAAFQHLFVLFARIFMLSFSPGDMSPAREMKIFGKTVSCQPDLCYEIDSRHPVLLVSVAEVNKAGPAQPEVAQSATGSGSVSGPPPPKRLKAGNENDDRESDFPSSVKGRHAVELLLDVPYTILNHSRDKKCVLGFVVQATKVRFTCLEIQEDHIKQLQEPEFRPLDEDRSAHIYYTAPLDMLVKNDWEELVEMMITLSSIGEKSTRPLDYALLSSFLPESD